MLKWRLRRGAVSAVMEHLAPPDGADAARGYEYFTGQKVDADLHRFHELFPQNLPGMDRFELWFYPVMKPLKYAPRAIARSV